MNTKPGFWQLLRYALEIGSFTGLVLGGCFGLVVGLLFSSGNLPGFVYVWAIALIVGMLIGIGFAIINGLIIAWLTQKFFAPPHDAGGYHRTIGWVCTLGSLMLSIGIVAKIDFPFAFGYWFVYLIYALITFAAWWASQKVCDWYAGDGMPSGI